MAQFADDPAWKVWLTRLLVSAVIIVALEFWGARPAVKKEDKPRQKEDVPVIQYSELLKEDPPKEEESVSKEEKENQSTKDIPKEGELSEEPATKSDDNISVQVDPNAAKAVENIKDEDIYGDNTAEKKQEEATPNEINEPESANTNTSTTPTTTPTPAIKFRNKSNYHPGMDAFHRWYDIETSLFRQYNVGRTDGVDVIPPYVKKSRNGQVRVSLRVENEFYQRINVYWINYTGHEVLKGSIAPRQTWHQTTYIEHPWVFRIAETDELLLHYIPERVIPTLEDAPTIDDNDPMVGIQPFVIKRPSDQAIRDHFICSIEDKIMPHPASHRFHNPNQAHTWTLMHMRRMDYFTYNPNAQLLVKYLTNIALHPEKASYRHIRIANRNFASGIWDTPARGLLLALGFVEQHAFAELGTAAPLSTTLIKDVSLAFYRLEQCLQSLGQSTTGAQPEGADGFGRSGWGRAGELNSVRR